MDTDVLVNNKKLNKKKLKKKRKAAQSAMAAEATAQANVRAKLVDSPLSFPLLRVNDLVDE